MAQPLPPSAASIETTTEEIAVLAGMILAPDLVSDVMHEAAVTADDFAIPRHRELWLCILRCQQQLKSNDITLLHRDIIEHNKSHWIPHQWLAEILLNAGNTATTIDHAKKVHRLAKIRALKTLCQQIYSSAELTVDMTDEQLNSLYSELMQQIIHTSGSERLVEISALLAQPRRSNESTINPAYPRTGLLDVDRNADLFEPGALTVIGAQPRIGKSSLVRHLIAANAGKPFWSLVCSLEEPATMLRDKLVSSLAGVGYRSYIQRELGSDGLNRIDTAISVVAAWQLYVTDGVMTADDICSAARRLGALGRPPRVIYVDHLQHMSHERQRGESDASMIGRSALSMANLAKELRCTVVLLSQLNRNPDHRDSPRPYLSDLRESGKIEELAFNVLMLWADDPQQSERYFYLAKQRNGPSFEARVGFNMALGKFFDVARTGVQ